jgi:hypothetical protein
MPCRCPDNNMLLYAVLAAVLLLHHLLSVDTAVQNSGSNACVVSFFRQYSPASVPVIELISNQLAEQDTIVYNFMKFTFECSTYHPIKHVPVFNPYVQLPHSSRKFNMTVFDDITMLCSLSSPYNLEEIQKHTPIVGNSETPATLGAA